MTKPAGQEAHATDVRPAAASGDDPFGLAPWLKEMPGVPLHPLMANPVAAMAATTAIGFSIAGQMAGLMLEAMQGAASGSPAAADETKVGRTDASGAERQPETVAKVSPATQPQPRADAKQAQPEAVARGKAAPVVAKKTEPAEKPAKAAPARKATRARTAKADDLKVISGVGPKLEQVLNGMGVTRYADIAAWSASDVARIEAELGLDGRIARDGWVEQAKGLAKG
jgi:NADH-quinone oxidoreductase subunit E